MINAFLQAVNKHVVAESTNIQATYDAKHIFNVRAGADIDNGKVVNLDDMAWVDNEYFTMVQPTSTSRVGLILSVPIGADERPKAATYEYNFYNGKDEIMRVYDLMAGDKFTISENGITKITSGSGDSATTTELAKGQYIVADGYNLKAQAAKPAASVAFYGEIVDVINRTNGKFYKIFVRKNG